MDVDEADDAWIANIVESDLLFSHLPHGKIVTSFGGHIPVSWV
jgi:hypothetical protein